MTFNREAEYLAALLEDRREADRRDPAACQDSDKHSEAGALRGACLLRPARKPARNSGRGLKDSDRGRALAGQELAPGDRWNLDIPAAGG